MARAPSHSTSLLTWINNTDVSSRVIGSIEVLQTTFARLFLKGTHVFFFFFTINQLEGYNAGIGSLLGRMTKGDLKVVFEHSSAEDISHHHEPLRREKHYFWRHNGILNIKVKWILKTGWQFCLYKWAGRQQIVSSKYIGISKKHFYNHTRYSTSVDKSNRNLICFWNININFLCSTSTMLLLFSLFKLHLQTGIDHDSQQPNVKSNCSYRFIKFIKINVVIKVFLSLNARLRWAFLDKVYYKKKTICNS